SAVFNAGAITSANSTGVSSGTTSSRGVRAVSAKRRPASVRSACVPVGRATRGAARAVLWAMLVMSSTPFELNSGGLGEAAAREAQVDVVEARAARRDRGHRELEHLELGDRRGRATAGERHRERRADRERVRAGNPVVAQAPKRLLAVAVDAEL